MRRLLSHLLVCSFLLLAGALTARAQITRHIGVAAGSPEDKALTEIGATADTAQKLALLDKFMSDFGQNGDLAIVGNELYLEVYVAQKNTAKTYEYGDQIGTTSLAFINSQIQPTQTPKVFETLNDVKSALQDKQIAAFVTDTPTAQYISSSEIPGTIMVAQFPSTGEHYGLLFAKGNPLVGCVNKALTTLTSNGTLAHLQDEYLQIYTSVPTIQP